MLLQAALTGAIIVVAFRTRGLRAALSVAVILAMILAGLVTLFNSAPY